MLPVAGAMYRNSRAAGRCPCCMILATNGACSFIKFSRFEHVAVCVPTEMQSNGQRLILTSGIDYGPVMHPLIFMKCVCFDGPISCCVERSVMLH